MSKRLFDAIRQVKGAALTQADVDLINRALLPEPAPVPSGLQTALVPKHRPSDKAFAIIKEFEGLHKVRPDGRIEAYRCPANVWTIGYGATGPGIGQGTVWTREQAVARLETDVLRFAAGVSDLIGDAPTKQGEFDACTSLAFNVGLGAFGKSTLLRRHKEGNKDGAAREFAKWVRGGGKVLPGLVRRREEETKLYRGQR